MPLLDKTFIFWQRLRSATGCRLEPKAHDHKSRTNGAKFVYAKLESYGIPANPRRGSGVLSSPTRPFWLSDVLGYNYNIEFSNVSLGTINIVYILT